VAGFCEHGDEASGSVKGVLFIGQLSDCQLLHKHSTVAAVRSNIGRDSGQPGHSLASHNGMHLFG
jgi:hypothetical protein